MALCVVLSQFREYLLDFLWFCTCKPPSLTFNPLAFLYQSKLSAREPLVPSSINADIQSNQRNSADNIGTGAFIQVIWSVLYLIKTFSSNVICDVPELERLFLFICFPVWEYSRKLNLLPHQTVSAPFQKERLGVSAGRGVLCTQHCNLIHPHHHKPIHLPINVNWLRSNIEHRPNCPSRA